MPRSRTPVVAVVEARMGSTRLPGKVLLEAGGRPMLGHLVDRLRQVPSIESIVIATTINPRDDSLQAFCVSEQVECFRGSEDDVLARVLAAAEFVKAKTVVNITGDCPIIDSGIVELVIRTHQANGDPDYTSNCHIRSYPDGMDVQVCRIEALREASTSTQDMRDREHVTLYIRQHPELFRQIHVVAPPNLHWPELGLTLDEPEDFELIENLIDFFGSADSNFTCEQVITAIHENPVLSSINAHVRRKGDS